MSDNVNNSDSVAAQKRKQFWVKLATIAILLIIAFLKPKVEAWLDGKANTDNVAANDTQPADSNSDVVIKDVPGNDDLFADLLPDSDSIGSSKNSANDPGGSGTFKITDPNDSVAGIQSPGDAVAGNNSKSSNVLIANANNDKQTGATRQTSPTGQTGASTKSSSGSSPSNTASGSKPGTSAKATGSNPRSNPNRDTTSNSRPKANDEPPLGKLTLTNKSREEFRSTAGLMYVRGSEDGHRLKHVLQHAKDNLDKPVHGVYSGGRDQILAWIDKAYLKGKQGGKGTRVENQGGRTVYTVDLGEKIGFVGGQVGERKRHPDCRYLRLVIQNNNEVVTAYPSQSL